jgi:prepilin-type N-terminal cleavage/methylation domain-containing protein
MSCAPAADKRQVKTMLWNRSREESAFTLIEILVVILIIGILAGIAIPSLLSQTTKATDLAARSQARTAETAAETYATDHSGTYHEISIEAVKAIEPTLKDESSAKLEYVKENEEGGYVIESKSIATGNVFRIERTPKGELKRTCTVEKTGGCPPGGQW